MAQLLVMANQSFTPITILLQPTSISSKFAFDGTVKIQLVTQPPILFPLRDRWWAWELRQKKFPGDATSTSQLKKGKQKKVTSKNEWPPWHGFPAPIRSYVVVAWPKLIPLQHQTMKGPTVVNEDKLLDHGIHTQDGWGQWKKCIFDEAGKLSTCSLQLLMRKGWQDHDRKLFLIDSFFAFWQYIERGLATMQISSDKYWVICLWSCKT